MASNKYLKLWQEANKKKIKLTKQQEKEIKQIFENFYITVNKRLKKVNEKTLTERYLKEFKKYLEYEITKAYKETQKVIKTNVKATSELVAQVQIDFFEILNKKFDLKLDESFSSMFMIACKEAIEELLAGGMYKDRKGLSERIWLYTKNFEKDIDYIIAQGLAEKKSTFEIAKDLEKYVNPKAKKDFEWNKIYPNINKTIDYNALRLARTSINHAFQQAQIRSAKKNPYTKGIRWESALAHGRTCSLCRERDGTLYNVDNVPLDHPNGLCTTTVELTNSIDEIGADLKEWLNGTSNPKLDKAFDEYKNNK